MDNLIIECVWYESKRDFNKFIKSLESNNVSVIDYSLIRNKLIKADPYTNEPHDSIVGLNIMSMLKKCFNGKKEIDVIVYSLKNMELETVVNFKELVETHTEDYTFILNVLNMQQVPNKKILNKFDYVKFIDND